MGLVAAGVNGIKLDVGDEVIGLQVLPQAGDVFLVTTDGKAKRVAIKDFPTQGRYGKGVRAWELPRGVKLVGMGVGKGTTHLTLHLLKAAAKQIRIDEAPLRKRSALRGTTVVEVKPGDAVTALTESWAVERFIPMVKGEDKKAPPRKSK